VLHTAAYRLMLAVRDAIPRKRDLTNAEFATLRLRLITSAVACPEADLFPSMPGALSPCGP